MSRERRVAQRIVKELRKWGAKGANASTTNDDICFYVKVPDVAYFLRHEKRVLLTDHFYQAEEKAEEIFERWGYEAEMWKNPEQRLALLEALGL
jgi:hypothetical protein